MRCPIDEVCAFIAGQLATQAEERRAGLAVGCSTQALAQIARPPLAPRKINLWATIRTAHQGWSKAAEEPGTLRTAKLEEHFTRVKGLFEAGAAPEGQRPEGGILSLKLRASPTKATMATPFAQN